MTTSRSTPSSRTPALILVGVVLTALALAVGMPGGGDDQADLGRAYGTPNVSGAVLPRLLSDAADPAVGSAAPEVSGLTTTGEQITIGAPGRRTIVAFVAHWCPHCQAEVPVVVDWLADGGLGDVELVAVATATDAGQPNYPPALWLEQAGWTQPVLLDDDADGVGAAYGVSSFPFWVVLGADGTVVQRATGELTSGQLDDLVAAARAG